MRVTDTGQLEELLYKILSPGNTYRQMMADYIDTNGFAALLEKSYRLHLTNELDRRLKAVREVTNSLRLGDYRLEFMAAMTVLTGISKEMLLTYRKRNGFPALFQGESFQGITERQQNRLANLAEFIKLYLLESEDTDHE